MKNHGGYSSMRKIYYSHFSQVSKGQQIKEHDGEQAFRVLLNKENTVYPFEQYHKQVFF